MTELRDGITSLHGIHALHNWVCFFYRVEIKYPYHWCLLPDFYHLSLSPLSSLLLSVLLNFLFFQNLTFISIFLCPFHPFPFPFFWLGDRSRYLTLWCCGFTGMSLVVLVWSLKIYRIPAESSRTPIEYSWFLWKPRSLLCSKSIVHFVDFFYVYLFVLLF